LSCSDIEEAQGGVFAAFHLTVVYTYAMWLSVPSYPGYYADEEGSIKGPKSVRKTHVNKRNYEVVNIWTGHYSGNVRVHQMVCEAFYGPKPPGHEVRHLNGDTLDNRAINLAWGTKSENMLDKVAHGNHHEVNRTHCPYGHEYTPENTAYWDKGTRKRKCRECNRLKCREKYAKRQRRKE
jgi:hypothetical protein